MPLENGIDQARIFLAGFAERSGARNHHTARHDPFGRVHIDNGPAFAKIAGVGHVLENECIASSVESLHRSSDERWYRMA